MHARCSAWHKTGAYTLSFLEIRGRIVQPRSSSSHAGLSNYNHQGMDSPTRLTQQKLSSAPWQKSAPIVGSVFGLYTKSSMPKGAILKANKIEITEGKRTAWGGHGAWRRRIRLPVLMNNKHLHQWLPRDRLRLQKRGDPIAPGNKKNTISGRVRTTLRLMPKLWRS